MLALVTDTERQFPEQRETSWKQPDGKISLHIFLRELWVEIHYMLLINDGKQVDGRGRGEEQLQST